MPLRLSIPLPGPFTWSQSLSGAIGGKGCFTFLLWMIVGPLLLCFVMLWVTAAMAWAIIVLTIQAAVWLVMQLAGKAA